MVFRHPTPHLAGLVSYFSTSCACLLAALLLISCSSSSTGISNATPTEASGSPRSTPTVTTSIPQAAPTVITNLAPVTTPLAPPPGNCAIMPSPQEKHVDSIGSNINVQLVGSGVFWMYAEVYPSVLHVGQLDSNRGWPMTKWIVEVGPDYSLPVTLRLQDTQTNKLAWWTDGQTPPRAATQTLILDPNTDIRDVGSVPGVPEIPHGPAEPYSEWGLFPVIPAACCYSLEVSWSGGSWQSIIAVGS